MIMGTSHFVSMPAAIRYYREYGFTERDTRDKVKRGEISIGAPTVNPNHKLFTVASEGRYFIEDKETP